MSQAHSYSRNELPVSHAEFIACALHPSHSVTVEACAGSGKTWLLVGRLLRLLLAAVILLVAADLSRASTCKSELGAGTDMPGQRARRSRWGRGLSSAGA